jgi:hypothetical protein
MSKAADLYLDFAIIRQIELQRVATWILEQMVDDLRTLEQEINGEILTTNPTGVTRARYRAERLAALLAAVQAKIRAVFRELAERVESQFQEVADIQQEHERKLFLLLWGLSLRGTETNAAQILIQGATLRTWITKIGADYSFRVSSKIRTGTNADKPARDIVDDIKGTPAPPAPPTSSEVEKAARDLEAITRTGADQVANDVTTDLIEANEENPPPVEPPQEPPPPTLPGSKFGPHGWQQISILDNRTTQICQNYAFRLWDANFEPVGHSLPYNGGPPRHIYCRSRIVFVFLDDQELPTRATFEQWLNRRAKKVQDRIFGSKKMDLHRRGKLTDGDLIRQQDRQLDLEGLRASDPTLPESD